jgi:hypothetical protein
MSQISKWAGHLALAAFLVSFSIFAGAFARPATADTYIAQCSILSGTVAPSEWSSGCLGGSANFDQISWSNWGAEGASGSGVALPNDCDPNCAEGTVYRYPARFIALGPKRCLAEPGNEQYVRLKTEVEFPADNPFEQPAGWSSTVWKLDASNCTAEIAVFEQGVGVILERRPKVIDARRNIHGAGLAGLDTWVIGKWLRFGGPRAVASATYWWHTPDGSSFRRYRSKLVLDRLGRCGSEHVYTRISGRFLGPKPPGMGRRVSKAAYKAECF